MLHEAMAQGASLQATSSASVQCTEQACSSSSLLVQDDHVRQVRQCSVVMTPVQQLIWLQVCQLDDVSCDGVACDDLLRTNPTSDR